jgi:hypothetical protein
MQGDILNHKLLIINMMLRRAFPAVPLHSRK